MHRLMQITFSFCMWGGFSLSLFGLELNKQVGKEEPSRSCHLEPLPPQTKKIEVGGFTKRRGVCFRRKGGGRVE